MKNTSPDMDEVIEETVDEIIGKINGFGSELESLEVAEIYLSLSDKLRAAGNAMRETYRVQNADPQFTKKR